MLIRNSQNYTETFLILPQKNYLISPKQTKLWKVHGDTKKSLIGIISCCEARQTFFPLRAQFEVATSTEDNIIFGDKFSIEKTFPEGKQLFCVRYS